MNQTLVGYAVASMLMATACDLQGDPQASDAADFRTDRLPLPFPGPEPIDDSGLDPVWPGGTDGGGLDPYPWPGGDDGVDTWPVHRDDAGLESDTIGFYEGGGTGGADDGGTDGGDEDEDEDDGHGDEDEDEETVVGYTVPCEGLTVDLSDGGFAQEPGAGDPPQRAAAATAWGSAMDKIVANQDVFHARAEETACPSECSEKTVAVADPERQTVEEIRGEGGRVACSDAGGGAWRCATELSSAGTITCEAAVEVVPVPVPPVPPPGPPDGSCAERVHLGFLGSGAGHQLYTNPDAPPATGSERAKGEARQNAREDYDTKVDGWYQAFRCPEDCPVEDFDEAETEDHPLPCTTSPMGVPDPTHTLSTCRHDVTGSASIGCAEE